MASYNKIILMGNLTRDPQLSYLPSQTPVVEIALAVSRRWKAQDGQQRDEVCFIDCRAYGRTSETINKYFTKGRPILIEGRLQFDTWQSQDGTKRSKHRVFVETFQFVGSRQGAPAGDGREAAAPAGGPREGVAPPPADDRAEPPPPEPYDDPGFDGPGNGGAAAGGGGDNIPF